MILLFSYVRKIHTISRVHTSELAGCVSLQYKYLHQKLVYTHISFSYGIMVGCPNEAKIILLNERGSEIRTNRNFW